MKKAKPSSLQAGFGEALVDWAAASGKSHEVFVQTQRHIKRQRRRRIAAASGALAILLAVGVTWQSLREPSESAVAVPSTIVVHRPERQTLPDGSVVELKRGAVISVAYTGQHRHVALISGEAHFAVTKDPSRPFIVRAGGVDVRAVGTAFSVEYAAGGVDVLVTEGRVAVESAAASSVPNGSAAPLAMLEAGERVSIAAGHSTASTTTTVTTDQQQQRLAWRVPLLEFNGTDLSSAVAMFNQHGRVRITLEPALSKLQLSGILPADQSEAFLRLLRDEFGIEAVRRGDAEIHLRSR